MFNQIKAAKDAMGSLKDTLPQMTKEFAGILDEQRKQTEILDKIHKALLELRVVSKDSHIEDDIV